MSFPYAVARWKVLC